MSSEVAAAVTALESGGIVLIPTDTVYGLAVSPGVVGAVERIFSVKGRPPDKPIPVLGTSRNALNFVVTFDERAARLADRFWPGPMTLILPRAPSFDLPLGEPGSSVAVRVPDHAIALDLLGLAGPLAVTSANRSGEPEATTVDEARAVFGDDVAVYVDGGRCAGKASTVISLVGTPEILRTGPLAADDIEACIGSSE